MKNPNKRNPKNVLLIVVAIIAVIAGSAYFFLEKSNFYRSENIIPNKSALKNVMDKSWEGEWTLEGAVQNYSGTLVIKNQTDDAFSFSLDTSNGAHSGTMSGQAKVTGEDALSTVGDSNEKEYQCRVNFNKSANNIIKIETTNDDCIYSRGARAFFAGDYVKNGVMEERTLKNMRVHRGGGLDEREPYIFKNDDEINAFQKLVGDNYVKLFIDSFQWVHRGDDTENLNARIYNGGVVGVSTHSEGIIIIGSPNRIWAAVIDYDAVMYFTNVPDYTNRLPGAIEEWRERFQDKKVIFMNGH